MSTFNLFTPAPREPSLAERIARQPSGIKFPNVPRPWHAEFVGPKQPATMANFYDPRPDAKLD